MTRTVSNLVADLQNAYALNQRITDYLDKEQAALADASAKWEGLAKDYTHEYLLKEGGNKVLPPAYAAANTYRGFRDTKKEVATAAIAILNNLSKLTTPKPLSADGRVVTTEAEYELSSLDRQSSARTRIAKCLDSMITGIRSRLDTFEKTTKTAASSLDTALRGVRNAYSLPSPGYLSTELATKWGLDRAIDEIASPANRTPQLSQINFETLNREYQDKADAAKALNHIEANEEVEKLDPEIAAERLETLADQFEKVSQGSVAATAVPLPVKEPSQEASVAALGASAPASAASNGDETDDVAISPDHAEPVTTATAQPAAAQSLPPAISPAPTALPPVDEAQGTEEAPLPSVSTFATAAASVAKTSSTAPKAAGPTKPPIPKGAPPQRQTAGLASATTGGGKKK